MARLQDRLPQNAPGEFFVDSTCIDCDTCRWLAPSVFEEAPGIEMSYVATQPDSAEATRRALMALVACPTSSIGTVSKFDPTVGVESFPEEIAPGIYYCGYASEDSFGASSYLVTRPSGNVLIDSPRAATPLLRRIAALGGVDLMFLTHRDDVADHQKFADTFGCRRVMHKADVGRSTAGIEWPIEGLDPVALDDELLVVPTPGHTRGSAVLLYQNEYLFTGDHLWYSPSREGLGASQRSCWYSWPEQVKSMERLLDYRFRWVLPGHGRRWEAESHEAMHAEMERLVQWMRSVE